MNTMSTPASPATSETLVSAVAVRVGEHIDVRSIPSASRLASGPLALSLPNDGVVVLLRYGVLVFFDTDARGRENFIDSIRQLIRRPLDRDETEELTIRIDPDAREGVDGETLIVHDRSIERLQVIADILGKSVAMAAYEAQSAAVFDRIEPFATDLAQTGHGGRHLGRLQKHLGNVLLIQNEMIGRVEVDDKPEILWERPDLERLHAVLHEEFEIHERKLALERKLSLVSQTAETVVGVIQNTRALRVEWYIVILIVFEIVLWIFELIFM